MLTALSRQLTIVIAEVSPVLLTTGWWLVTFSRIFFEYYYEGGATIGDGAAGSYGFIQDIITNIGRQRLTDK